VLTTWAAGAGLAGAKEAGSGVSSELLAAGWRLLKVPGEAHAEFRLQGPESIGIKADKAVAFLYRPVDQGMDPKRRLAWRWRVDETVRPTDLSRAPGDDRSLAVHLVFPADEDRLSFWERIEIAIARFVAPPLAGKVLTYVWGGTHIEGSVLSNPHLGGHGKIIVLRRGDGPVDRWFTEQVDFVTDFRKVFGYAPPAPTFVAISADSDDTGGRIFGTITGLGFEG
jgi:hypothetical protein